MPEFPELPTDNLQEFETIDYIPDEIERDIRNMIMCEGGAGKIAIGQDYALYERVFPELFLLGLNKDVRWIEEHYKNDFIDSKIQRSGGRSDENDVNTYHRIGKVFWLTYVKEHDLQYVPYLAKFKKWIKLLKAAINK